MRIVATISMISQVRFSLLLGPIVSKAQGTVTKQVESFFRVVSLNSLTPICVPAGTKNYPSVDFLRRNSTFFLISAHTTTHKQHHHGELPPPPAARILQLDPIRRKPDEEEGLGEGAVEAIQLNR
jgi:hypothetical protein